MTKNRRLALCLALLPLLYGQARAQEAENADFTAVGDVSAAIPDLPAGTTIDARQLEIQMGREMHAIGDAELHQDQQAIYADRIDFDILNNTLHAIGNTRIETVDKVFTGPELQLQLEDHVGEMKEPTFRIKLPPKAGATIKPAEYARGDAKTMLFDGPTKETYKDLRYTTCEEGVDDWFVKAKDLEMNHYTQTAFATNASVEFKGVPILYTPWLYFPLSHQRESGFLSPTFGVSSRNGIEFMLPYYWNIAPNMDATIAPRYLALRGVQTKGEFRYLESDFSGTDTLEFLPNDESKHTNRYYMNLNHAHNFGNGLSGGFAVQRVSDSNYFADLSTSVVATSTINMPQQANLNYSNYGWNINALMQQYQTLDQASYPYQRLPQLTVTRSDDWGARSFDKWLGGDNETDSHVVQDTTLLHTDFYGEWVRFDRNHRATATLTADRLTLQPSISLPFAAPYGYLTPKLGTHVTDYSLGGIIPTGVEGGTTAVPFFSADAGLYFDRDFKVIKNEYLQTLEPRLLYVYAPHIAQSRQPIFDTGLSDFKTNIYAENIFSGNDRFNDANQLTMGLTSRIIDSKTGIQKLSGTVAQRVYFSDQKVSSCVIGQDTTDPGCTRLQRTNTVSDMLASFSARPFNSLSIDGTAQFDTNLSQFVTRNFNVHYAPETGKILNVSYRIARPSGEPADTLNQIDAYAEWPLFNNRWIGLGQISYSLVSNTSSRLGQAVGGIEYNAGCWQARAVAQRIPAATLPTPTYAIFFQLELGGLASVGTSPLDLLKRNIPGYVNSSWIPDTTH